MAKKNIRLFVALEPALYADVMALSKMSGKSPSTVARDLIRGGCESLEGRGLAMMAARREASARARRWLRPSEAWR